MDVQVHNNHSRAPARAVVAPSVDILENESEILLLADVPGASASTLELTIERGVLSMKARTEPRSGDVLLAEGLDADYARAFRLPRGVQADGIRASLENGVLSVRVPKREATQNRRIPVSSA